jgi:hypothetical protein
MNHLMPSLIDKNGLTDDTVITAYHVSKDAYGRIQRRCDDFILVDVLRQGSDYKLKLKSIAGASIITVNAIDVVALDGMDPARFVDIYDINPDGTSKCVGKKRGRKPKDLVFNAD